MMRARHSGGLKPALPKAAFARGGGVKPALWMTGLARMFRRVSGLKDGVRTGLPAKGARG